MALPLTARAFDPGTIQHLFDASQSLEPKSVLIQASVMTALSILTVITFNMLRPRNKIVYEPKMTYHAPDKKPPRISSSFCGWIPPLCRNREPELFNRIGLDAIAFLRFLHLMRWLFTLTALVGCGTLIPIDFMYTLSNKPAEYDLLSAMTIRDVHGVRLYAHIGLTYLITLFLILLVNHHWYAMYRLRQKWFRSSEYQNAFYPRTLLVTHIPPRFQSDQGLQKIFTGMKLPYQVNSVHIGRHVGVLPELVERHNDTVKEFEDILAKHAKKDPSGETRPMIRVGGICGLGGRKQDATKYYTTKLKHTEASVQQYRSQLNTHKPENFGFVSMASIPAAHGAAYELRNEHPKGLTIKLAPNPKDIFWKNIGLSRPHRRFRRAAGFILLVFFCALSLLPLFPIASLANLDALAQSGYIPFLQTWVSVSPATYTLVSGIVPPAVAAIFSNFLPRLMRWLSKYMGAYTTTSLDRVVVARYFTFMVVSQLIIFTIIGVIFQSILEIIQAAELQTVTLKLVFDHLHELPARITRTYVDQSAFWLKWFPLRGFLVLFDLAQLANLMLVRLKTKYFGRTPREIREWTKPPVFEYPLHYSNFLFMGAVGLVFAPLAPLVTLAAALVFWLCSWVYKYQLMFMFITHIESGGRSWNVVINRLLFSTIFMQIIMVFTIGLQIQFRSLQFLATIPPLFVQFLFKYYMNRRFANEYQYFLPRHDELTRAIVHSEESDYGGQKLEARYDNPALHTTLYTPMIHAQMAPLLHRIFGRRRTRDRGDLARGVDSGEDKALEGVQFTPVKENELACDPAEYSRDRQSCDCDLDSLNPTPLGDGELYPTAARVAHGSTASARPRVSSYDSHHDPPVVPSKDPAYVQAPGGASRHLHHSHPRQPTSISDSPSYGTESHLEAQPDVTNAHTRPTADLRRTHHVRAGGPSRRHHSAHSGAHHGGHHPRQPTDQRAQSTSPLVIEHPSGHQPYRSEIG